jgi:hypothetical protein
MKKGQSRETGNIGHTKQKHNTICVGRHLKENIENKTNVDAYLYVE